MLRKLLPVIMALIGLAGGIGAGLALKPPPNEEEAHAAPEPAPPPPEAFDYVKLNNQFIVPLLRNGRATGLVILTLSLEVTPGSGPQVYAREPRLRDGFLQVLFDHANSGGFDGAFTDALVMGQLRTALMEIARKELADVVHNVLILDIVRQSS